MVTRCQAAATFRHWSGGGSGLLETWLTCPPELSPKSEGGMRGEREAQHQAVLSHCLWPSLCSAPLGLVLGEQGQGLGTLECRGPVRAPPTAPGLQGCPQGAQKRCFSPAGSRAWSWGRRQALGPSHGDSAAPIMLAESLETRRDTWGHTGLCGDACSAPLQTIHAWFTAGMLRPRMWPQNLPFSCSLP